MKLIVSLSGEYIRYLKKTLNLKRVMWKVNVHELMYSLLNSKFNTSPAFLSKDFHPAFSRIAEIRAIVTSGTPLIDCTATKTRSIQEESVSTLK